MSARETIDSPVSNNGRGLKPEVELLELAESIDSPVSNNGRGLKPGVGGVAGVLRRIRPLAITGVD